MKLRPKLPADQKAKALADLEKLSHYEMAKLYRFCPVGSLFFADTDVYARFKQRFAELGGMTPELSKQIGWEK